VANNDEQARHVAELPQPPQGELAYAAVVIFSCINHQGAAPALHELRYHASSPPRFYDRSPWRRSSASSCAWSCSRGWRTCTSTRSSIVRRTQASMHRQPLTNSLEPKKQSTNTRSFCAASLKPRFPFYLLYKQRYMHLILARDLDGLSYSPAAPRYAQGHHTERRTPSTAKLNGNQQTDTPN
jgi:hypothetical protein